jgi:hypothetical protein
MRAGDQLDGIEAGLVQPLRDGKHHAGGHILRPQALVAVADRRIDEFNSVRVHLKTSQTGRKLSPRSDS